MANIQSKAAATTRTSLRESGPTTDNSTCIIATGTVLEGTFNTKESIRVDGTISGTISCEKRLVVGERGRAEGTINAKDATIKGRVEGDLHVTETLQLMSTAIVSGNIHAKKLIVEEGAVFDGNSKIINS